MPPLDNIVMKGDSITFILIITVAVSLTVLVMGWAVMNMSGFFETSEINAVRGQFLECNDKIMETARTGLSNKCIFSIQNGEITGTTDNITYEITSREKVCDTSGWVQINPEKNTWQMCSISGRESVFKLMWNNSKVKFEFESLGNVLVTSQSGKTIDVSRLSMNDTQVNLVLGIY
jgi:hypothetical protein